MLLVAVAAVAAPAEAALPWWVRQLDLSDPRAVRDSLERLGIPLPEAIGEILDEFDPETVNRWWVLLERTLQEASIEDLAELQPVARALLAEAKRRPRFAAYALWLEARMDYFDEARRLVATPPPPAPPTPPRPTTPPARPPTPTRPAAVRVGDPLVWRQRVVRRPRPPAADRIAPALRSVFRQNGVPEALIWVAEVESGMNPAARSPAGAVGLFQLMPNTARHLGVNPDARPDERLDPLKNADAAARYLRHLHRRFRDWPLALAAYNAGQGRVARLLRETGGADFAAIAPRLPLETRMYVPRVLETIRVREGVDPATLPPPR